MKNVNRRDFARKCLAVAATGFVFSKAHAAKSAPLAFSTLGCPAWDWKTIIEQAKKMGYSGLELRGIKKQMDLPTLPEFAGTAWKQSLKEVEDSGLKIINLGASTQLHEPRSSRRKADLDSAKKFIDLAHNLKCPYIRVFGDRFVKDEPRQATVDRVIAGLKELGEHAKGSGVTVLLESHGDFNKSSDLKPIFENVGMSEVGLLWDMHHTYVFGNEPPAETWKQMRKYVRHLHIKDSRREGSDVRYMLIGTGTVPVKETISILRSGGYKGWYSLEWEKGWHPELEEPEVAFPYFVKMMREYLGES
ncbi:MAG TPA: sugar phosphate isomerase/epimerase family protein [Acidobacteriota bacterium]|nr:sugar phosphate isomerase/epimerase family protein [Acidobacteriota bacterium]